MSATRPNIEVNRRDIAKFCERNNIQSLSFFGSVLRPDFNEKSDVDVLVEFEAKHVPGLIRLSAMERELSEILGRRADLRTPQDLSKYFRDQVLATASIQYAR